MTATPDHSEGEPTIKKLKDSLAFASVLQSHEIDQSETSKRAILSVTKRRFTDD